MAAFSGGGGQERPSCHRYQAGCYALCRAQVRSTLLRSPRASRRSARTSHVVCQLKISRLERPQELFFFDELSPGSCFFLPLGGRLYGKLVEMIKEQYWLRGYDEVRHTSQC